MRAKTAAKYAGGLLAVLVVITWLGPATPPPNGVIPLQLFSKSTQRQLTPSLLYSLDNFCARCPRPLVFDDALALAFIRTHPLDFIPDPVSKWDSFAKGWNGGVGRSEFFRFYYLFVAGGIYLDHDAVLATDAAELVRGYELVVVNAWLPPGSSPYIMAGFIAAAPRNELVKQALLLLYQTAPSVLEQNYLFTCQTLFKLFHSSANYRVGTRILEEIYEHGHSFSGTTIVSADRCCAGRHMFRVGDNGDMDEMSTMLKWMYLTPKCFP